MIVTSEIELRSFEFWSGAKSTAAALSYSQLDQVEQTLEDLYPDGMTDTQVNDIFWFEPDFIAQCIGYRDWEDFENDDDEEDE